MFMLANGQYSSDLDSLDVTFPNVSNGNTTIPSFQTNNFNFVIALTGSLYRIEAQRANKGETVTTGELAYKIGVDGDLDGNVVAGIFSTGASGGVCTTSTCEAIKQNEFFKKYRSHVAEPDDDD